MKKTVEIAAAVCMAFVFVLGAATLSGCTSDGHRDYPVEGRRPVLDEEPRPEMESLTTDEIAELTKLSQGLREKMQRNTKKLMEWGDKQNVTITRYNGYAVMRNGESKNWMDQTLQTAPAK